MAIARQHVVLAAALHLRSAPRVGPDTVLGTLRRGQFVTVIGRASDPWWQIRAQINGEEHEGFAHRRYIGEAPGQLQNDLMVGEVHLPTTRSVCRSSGSRAHSLTESGRPVRTGPNLEHARQLTEILQWLNVEVSWRYKDSSGNRTFCNIYAHDYCYLARAYLPRVWWTNDALEQLRSGATLVVRYGHTVREMTANDLHAWLDQYGDQYGWRLVDADMSEIQRHANGGSIVIIVGVGRNHGHVSMVVPESRVAVAERVNHRVVSPLQTQAGEANHRYYVARWWEREGVRGVAFWVHE